LCKNPFKSSHNKCFPELGTSHTFFAFHFYYSQSSLKVSQKFEAENQNEEGRKFDNDQRQKQCKVQVEEQAMKVVTKKPNIQYMINTFFYNTTIIITHPFLSYS